MNDRLLRHTAALAAATVSCTSVVLLPSLPDAGAAVSVEITVDSFADTVDADPTDSVCSDATGHCSLRAALMEFGTPGSPETLIHLPSGRVELSIAGAESASAAGALDIGADADITIDGESALRSVIDANGIDRIFDVAPMGTLLVQDVSLLGGSTSWAGGAATVQGNFTADRVRFVENHANSGGAMEVTAGGFAVVSTSEVADNTTTSGGGGITVDDGTLLLLNSTVAHNDTGGVGTVSPGGLLVAGTSTVTVMASLVRDNDGVEVSFTDFGGAGSTGISFSQSIIGDGSDAACSHAPTWTMTSSGNNLFSDTSCTAGVLTDLSGAVPVLAPLGFYGGSTRVFYPEPSSPGIDWAASSTFFVDQRGGLRGLDGDGNGIAAHDIGPVERDAQLPDVGHTYPFFKPIAMLRRDGVTDAYGDGTFRPTLPVSRQVMAKFLYGFLHDGDNAPPCLGPAFPDVPESNQFCGAIAWMNAAGLASGYKDGLFHPGDPISRQTMAAILYRLVVGGTPPACSSAPFPDVPTTHVFCGHITWLVSTGITSGYPNGNYQPGEPVTRQTAAQFLQRLRGVMAPRS